MSRFFGRWARTGVAAGLLGSALAAQAETVVPGSANPNLAGRAPGYECCSGDSVSGQAAVLAAVVFAAGDHLAFSVTGASNYSGGPIGASNPDGNEGPANMSNYGDGISAPTGVRWNALMGVFLGPDSPTGAATPAVLDFGHDLSFASLSPAIGQMFFIGDGLTSDSNLGDFSGQAQHFIVPAGATRLFLGSSDGLGWYNNSGSFSVSVSVVPEPATWALWLSALWLLRWRVRRA